MARNFVIFTTGRRAMLGFGLALCAMLGVTPIHAQTDTDLGTRIPSKRSHSTSKREDIDKARIEAQHYATCIVKKRGNAARTYLNATDPAQIENLGRNMNYKDCYSRFSSELAATVSLQIPDGIYRGMLAEELLGLDRRTIAALEPEKLQNLYVNPFSDVSGRDPEVDNMAMCYAEVHPQELATLLGATAGTDEETKAFGTIASQLEPCLRRGFKLTANRQTLRAALAEALYHRANPIPLPLEGK